MAPPPHQLTAPTPRRRHPPPPPPLPPLPLPPPPLLLPRSTRHFVQLLSEWASLESLCVAVLALFANIGEIVDGMAESLEYEDDTETGKF